MRGDEVRKNGLLSTEIIVEMLDMTFQAGDSALVVYDEEGKLYGWCRWVRGRHPRSCDELEEAAYEWWEQMTAPVLS